MIFNNYIQFLNNTLLSVSHTIEIETLNNHKGIQKERYNWRYFQNLTVNLSEVFICILYLR